MKTLLLIDAHSLIHRCFHALPPLTNTNREHVGALYGVSSVLIKIITQKKPDYAAALFDRPEPTFRKEKFSAYKAHRPKAPDELISQLIRARELFGAFSIPVFEKPGFEGDDLIGTLATSLGKTKGVTAVVLTGDLDSLQLVSDGNVIVETFKKGISDTIIYDEAAVFERYHLTPSQLIDYKALVGDQSDNIPGVAGVGPKTAVTLLQKYSTLDLFFKNGQGESFYDKIISQKETAILSRELATIDCAVPLSVSLDDLIFDPSYERIATYFSSQGFSSLLRRIPSPHQSSPATQSPSPIATINTRDVVFLDTHATTLQQNEYASSKLKIGWDIKDIYKVTPFCPPFFDIKIALDLLGVDTTDWRATSEHLFKQLLEKEDFLIHSYEWIKQKLEHHHLSSLYNTVELPLIPILARMEMRGIAIDNASLSRVSHEMELQLSRAREAIASEVGPHINPNSPKQLLTYLKEERGLRLSSTSAEAIEKIKEKNPLPLFDKLAAYRELFKLKTTYVDAFSRLVYKDGRIHPTFLQLGAATGRMSCQNPNIQNIPQESTWSAPIRNVFVPSRGFSLVSLDYSQIELRVLASLSGDPDMTRAFTEGRDIHTLTASKIFNTPLEAITPHMRRLAKTLNFGMIYGMGARALAHTAHIPLAQAKEFIDRYFDEFSTIKQWQGGVLEGARAHGVVSNINGRFRSLPHIHSPNRYLAAEAERMAINMPTQSLAADILKLAMISVDTYIQKDNLGDVVRLLLSIHDELVFEIHHSLLNSSKSSSVVCDLQEIMERAFSLSVPLRVDVKMGIRWGEME